MKSFIDVFWDTETTGLKPGGDKMIEFAAVAYNQDREIVDRIKVYIDPLKEVPYEVFNVHKMDRAFLLAHGAKPFAEQWPIIEEFIQRVKASQWIAHNAGYDLTMTQSELDEMNGRKWERGAAGALKDGEEDILLQNIFEKYAPSGQCDILDSQLLARRVESDLKDDDDDYVDLSPEFDDGKNKTSRRSFKMDLIAKRFGVDLSKRDAGHEALIDCEILADIYYKLLDVDRKHGNKFAKVQDLKLSSRNDSDFPVIKRSGPIFKW